MKEKIIVHVDMDAFFAAIEQRDHPLLRGKPVIVGADPQGGRGRGVVSTCSYEARKFGVHSAQPISRAYQLCPKAVFLPVDFKKYHKVSNEIFDILYDFTPEIEPISIDEAFLDLTGSYHFFETPYKACQEIKRRIKDELMLIASIGIAPVKMVAKIASDLKKPDGLVEVKAENIQSFLNPLKIERLWGVGPKTQKNLNELGIYIIADILKLSLDDLTRIFGSHGKEFFNLARGIDDRVVEANDQVHSVGNEFTFDQDINDREKLHETLLYLSEKVSRRLRKASLKGKTLTVKIRLKGFKTFTRAYTFVKRVDLIDDIYPQAKRLFDEFHKAGDYVRLIGVRLSHFEDDYVQDDLFTYPATQKSEKIQTAMDKIKDKFGEDKIHRGARDTQTFA